MNKAKQIIETYLKNNGITIPSIVEKIVDGYDLTKPVYEQRIWRDDRLYQYVRNPSSFSNSKVGEWFCLKGATMNSLAIFGGGAGRNLTTFRVKSPIIGLEGTAKKTRRNWEWGGGGKGGATQIFIPRKMLYALEVLGTHL